jgi:CopG family transcriptional regulator/antitoxin EndoAI
MSKRINIILPETTVAVLDRLAPKGNRSRFIDRAVLRLVKTEGTANLREQLKAGALANARLNLELAEEWFPLEQEAWQRLEREEPATAKATRNGAKSTSRRSTRRSDTKSRRPGPR